MTDLDFEEEPVEDEDAGDDIEDEEVEEVEDTEFEYTQVTHPCPRAQSVHKYVDGYEFWLSPAFGPSFDYGDFDMHFGDEPWEVAVREVINEACAPIDRIEVGPDRVVAIYKERFNKQSDVITWSKIEDDEG